MIPCEWDKVELKRGKPSSLDSYFLEKHDAYYEMVSDVPTIVTKIRTRIKKEFELSIRDRFTKLSGPTRCLLEKFEIEKVVEKETEVKLTKFDTNLYFEISNRGFFRVKKFDVDFKNYLVYIKCFNGKVWSNSLGTHLLDITVDNSLIELP